MQFLSLVNRARKRLCKVWSPIRPEPSSRARRPAAQMWEPIFPREPRLASPGDYAFRAWPAATYKLLVNGTGFGTQELDNILLAVNQQTTVDVGR